MDGVGLGIAGHDSNQIVGEFRRAAIGSRFDEMASGLGFDAAEDIGSATPFLFAVGAQKSSRPHRAWRANIGMKDHRLFVHADHWGPVGERLLVDSQ